MITKYFKVLCGVVGASAAPNSLSLLSLHHVLFCPVCTCIVLNCSVSLLCVAPWSTRSICFISRCSVYMAETGINLPDLNTSFKWLFSCWLSLHQAVTWKSSTIRSSPPYWPSQSTRGSRRCTSSPGCAPSAWVSSKAGGPNTGEPQAGMVQAPIHRWPSGDAVPFSLEAQWLFYSSVSLEWSPEFPRSREPVTWVPQCCFLGCLFYKVKGLKVQVYPVSRRLMVSHHLQCHLFPTLICHYVGGKDCSAVLCTVWSCFPSVLQWSNIWFFFFSIQDDRRWLAPPAGLNCTLMDHYSGWTKFWPRWAHLPHAALVCPNAPPPHPCPGYYLHQSQKTFPQPPPCLHCSDYIMALTDQSATCTLF